MSAAAARMRRLQRAKAVLAVGGADPTAGAGVYADIRTLDALGVMPAAAVTAVTVQDGRRVRSVEPVTPALVVAQARVALETLPVVVVKTGMLARAATARALSRLLAGRRVTVVVDPVLASGSGDPLGDAGLETALKRHLFRLAPILTPNAVEAERLSGVRIRDAHGAIRAGEVLLELGASAVVVTGGHLRGDPCDVLITADSVRRWSSRRLPIDMHGTGCAFAAALAAGLAHGHALERAVAGARSYVRRLLACALRSRSGAYLRSPPR